MFTSSYAWSFLVNNSLYWLPQKGSLWFSTTWSGSTILSLVHSSWEMVTPRRRSRRRSSATPDSSPFGHSAFTRRCLSCGRWRWSLTGRWPLPVSTCSSGSKSMTHSTTFISARSLTTTANRAKSTHRDPGMKSSFKDSASPSLLSWWSSPQYCFFQASIQSWWIILSFQATCPSA